MPIALPDQILAQGQGENKKEQALKIKQQQAHDVREQQQQAVKEYQSNAPIRDGRPGASTRFPMTTRAEQAFGGPAFDRPTFDRPTFGCAKPTRAAGCCRVGLAQPNASHFTSFVRCGWANSLPAHRAGSTGSGEGDLESRIQAAQQG
jgi:hypothetical protein